MTGRFAEYATSGAFAVALTRSQVQGLALCLGGGTGWQGGALERKGLVERIEGRPDPFGSVVLADYRLTGAGVLVLSLCHMAGLTNAGADAATVEIDALRADLDAARAVAQDAVTRARSMQARLAESELELINARAEIARLKSRRPLGAQSPDEEKIHVRVLPRDPLPELSTAEVMEGLPS